MSEPRHVCVVVTARPSYSRIKTALEAINEHRGLTLSLVVAGSALLDRYGTAVHQIEADGFRVETQVHMVLEGENPTSMAKSTGLALLEISTVLHNFRPDVVVTIADRYETIANAVAAAYMNIPLAHVQGGEVSGSIDEKVRHAVTKFADLHLVATKMAAERVIRMGEDPSTVFTTGCPSVDLAARVARRPELDFDPMERYPGVGAPVDLSNGFVVVVHHPVTTEHHLARRHVEETLHVASEIELPVLWFWPNVDAGSDGTSKGIRAFRERHNPGNIHFFKNMGPEDFLRVIYNSRCLFGNSSVGIREAAFLGIPVVNIGSRQAGRERGRNVIDTGYEREEVRVAIEKQMSRGRFECDPIYGDGRAGERIAELLATQPLRIEKRLTY